jgi:hypothetical protein
MVIRRAGSLQRLDLFIYKNYIIINFSLMTMPWLRQIVASLSPRRLRSVHVGFVVDRVALGQVFSKFLSFPLSVTFNCGSVLICHLGDEQLACWWLQFGDIVLQH